MPLLPLSDAEVSLRYTYFSPSRKCTDSSSLLRVVLFLNRLEWCVLCSLYDQSLYSVY